MSRHSASRPRHPSFSSGANSLTATLLCAMMALPAPTLWANPSGGRVGSGSASISANGSTTTITQSSTRAVINWDSFSINAGELTRFVQPDATSAVLNRVLGGDPSRLLGDLRANGQVYLINPNGVLVGAGARIDAGAFLASTLNVTDADFMRGGDLLFTGDSTAAVRNLGAINASGGDIFLIARQVENHGSLRAPAGVAGLAAGSEILLTTGGEQRVFVRAATAPGQIVNSGAIDAASAELKAAGGNPYALAIHNTGVVRATGTATRDGQVWLVAGTRDHPSQAKHVNSGLARHEGEITAINADGTGGFVETSGVTIDLPGSVRTGSAGRWLIDPTNVTIDSTLAGNIASALNAGTDMTVEADNTITVAANIAAAGSGDLNLISDLDRDGVGTVVFDSGITISNTGGGDVNIFYNPTSYAAPTDYAPNVNLSGGGALTAYMWVHDVNQLQVINTNLSGTYALSGDIDASATAGWNSGAGFVPIGSTVSFTGTFDGRGHVIDGLVINRPSTNFVGLFGTTGSGAEIRDVGLSNVNISGQSNVGGLVGSNYLGTISQSYASGSVSGSGNAIGGLVGFNASGTITQSYASGSVSGTNYLGGLVGSNSGGSISHSYASGSVSGSNNVGGLVGWNDAGPISHSYASGLVSGSNNVGGLVGWNTGGGTISHGFWDTQTTGQSSGVGGGSTVGGVGITTASAKNAASYTGWDIGTDHLSNTWVIVQGQTRPMLAWEYSTTIHNAHQLQLIGLNSTTMETDYTIARDLDLSGTVNPADIWGTSQSGNVVTGSGFVPIGTGWIFLGTFDGRGHVIDGLVINRPTQSDIGLFSGTGDTAVIRNVGLTNVNISGEAFVGGLAGTITNSLVSRSYVTGRIVSNNDYVGGLVGDNGGIITQSYASAAVSGRYTVGGLVGSNSIGQITESYASGSVSGSNQQIGGLVGLNNRGTIEQSYATGSVSGTTEVGGLVGVNDRGSISQSYATGAVSGGFQTGGLVGNDLVGTMTQNFWDTQTTGRSSAVGTGSSSGATGLTTADLKTAAGYTGWDIGQNHLGNTWVILEGQTRPMLAWEYSTTINNTHQLQLIGLNATTLAADYTLARDLDLSGTVNPSDIWGTSMSGGIVTGAGFAPIGTNTAQFTGTFDGRGHVIDGLVINRPTTTYVGLFGAIANSAEIREVGLTNVNISGDSYVGGLVGRNQGLIIQSHSAGSVTATANQVGGLVGWNDTGGTISQSHASGSISGAASVGGIVGTGSGSLVDSYYLLAGDHEIHASDGSINLRGGVRQDDPSGDHTLTLTASQSVLLPDAISIADHALVVEAGRHIIGSNEIEAASLSLTAADTLTLQAGAKLVAHADGDSLVLSAGKLVNNAGADALETEADARWLAYIGNYAASTFGGLQSGNLPVWNRTLATHTTGEKTALAGNRFIFAATPELAVTSAFGDSKIYGDTYAFASPVAGTHYTITGFVDASTYGGAWTQETAANIGLSGAPVLASVGAAGTANANATGYAITLSTGDLANTAGYTFDFTDSTGVLVVDRRAITVTPNSGQSMVYGNVDPTLTYSITTSNLVNGDTLTGILARTGSDNVGVYAITQGSLAASSNYDLTFATGTTFAITPRSITVAALGGTSIYGNTATNPGVQLTSGSLAFTDTLASLGIGSDFAVTGQTNVGTYTISVTGSNNNYDITPEGGSWSVTPRSITVAANSGQGKIYGNANPTLTYTVGGLGLVNGDALTGSLARDTGDNVGAYAITQGDLAASANYDLAFTTGTTFAITPRALTLSADTISKIYGDNDGTLGVTITGGDLATALGDTLADVTGTLTRETGENVGSYDILLGSGAKAGNYDITFVADNNAFAITPRPITVTALGGTSIYGNTATNPGISLTGGTLAFTDTLASLGLSNDFAVTGATNVGPYSIAVTGSNANYDITPIAGSWSVTPRAITVSANSGQGRIYGNLDPTLTYAIGGLGLVNGDTLTGTLSREVGDNVGAYAITQGSLAASSNYDLTFTTGTSFAITPRALTLAADAISKIYGDNDGTLDVTITGGDLAIALGDTLADVTGTLTREAGENAGAYDILLGAGVKAGNYDITFVADNDAFTINKALLTITAEDLSRIFGRTNPAFTASYDGFKFNDDASVVSGLVLDSVADTVSPVGAYAITASGAIAANYDIVHVDGTLSVTAASPSVNGIAITPASLDLVPDERIPEFMGAPGFTAGSGDTGGRPAAYAGAWAFASSLGETLAPARVE